ncbi:hypothetical protein [Paraburkholderia azotifigens]|uniref:Uncharacterized protein n=1 Tax=Paraburkholderia azotifigens TaxID=2057004 RepID=A0A5C6VG73_9BURK|nr:hypothetical protein [Paraburkholderia azotifigens]TXC82388.1 hypothetical protein FRZ40_18040 [Paraburkholderia azotifigens]
MQKVRGRRLPADDPTIRRIVRALIRLHFSEWEYNGHLGGDELQSLLYASKRIFDLDPVTTTELDFEQHLLSIWEDWYPESSKDIELGGGYWNGNALYGLSAALDSELVQALRLVFEKNHFEVETRIKELLNAVKGMCRHTSIRVPFSIVHG